MMPAIYLDDLRFRDWAALYRIAQHPHFFYRALNDRNAWIAWRVARYILKAKAAKHLPIMQRAVKAIRQNETSAFLGCVVLVDWATKETGVADIGVFVGVPYQGKGIASAALARFVDWALLRYNLLGIETTAEPNNKASLQLQARLGLQRVGDIAADESHYFGRNGEREPRVIMRGDRAAIEKALLVACTQGVYSRSMPVL